MTRCSPRPSPPICLIKNSISRRAGNFQSAPHTLSVGCAARKGRWRLPVSGELRLLPQLGASLWHWSCSFLAYTVDGCTSCWALADCEPWPMACKGRLEGCVGITTGPWCVAAFKDPRPSSLWATPVGSACCRLCGPW